MEQTHLRALQLVQLEELKTVADFCDQNGIVSGGFPVFPGGYLLTEAAADEVYVSGLGQRRGGMDRQLR